MLSNSIIPFIHLSLFHFSFISAGAINTYNSAILGYLTNNFVVFSHSFVKVNQSGWTQTLLLETIYILTLTLRVDAGEKRKFRGLQFFISRGICRKTEWITLTNSVRLKNKNAKRIIEIGQISADIHQVKVMRFATRLKNVHRLKIIVLTTGTLIMYSGERNISNYLSIIIMGVSPVAEEVSFTVSWTVGASVSVDTCVTPAAEEVSSAVNWKVGSTRLVIGSVWFLLNEDLYLLCFDLNWF